MVRLGRLCKCKQIETVIDLARMVMADNRTYGASPSAGGGASPSAGGASAGGASAGGASAGASDMIAVYLSVNLKEKFMRLNDRRI